MCDTRSILNKTGNLNGQDFQTIINSSVDKPVFVMFTNPHCGACVVASPAFNAVAKLCGQKSPNKAVFAIVSSETSSDIFTTYDVKSTPTFMVFMNRQIVAKFAGFDLKALQQLTRTYLKTEIPTSVVNNIKSTLQSY